MKVIRGQETSLESSKGFYSGSSPLTDVMALNTMKVLSGQEASLESSKGFFRGTKCHLQKPKPTSMQSMRLLFQGQQLHLQNGVTSYHRSIEGWRGRRQRR